MTLYGDLKNLNRSCYKAIVVLQMTFLNMSAMKYVPFLEPGSTWPLTVYVNEKAQKFG